MKSCCARNLHQFMCQDQIPRSAWWVRFFILLFAALYGVANSKLCDHSREQLTGVSLEEEVPVSRRFELQ